MSNILIIYSTTDGHTPKICSRIKQVVEEQENRVTVIPVDNANSVDLDSFDKIVIGASIRYGKHHHEIYKFIESHLQPLENKPSAFFSVNVVARKPGKDRPETNPYLQKFLKQISWKPRQLGVFAGKIDYQKYRFLDRFMIRLIMKMTKGPTDTNTKIEYTNWDRVKEFGKRLNNL